jgi:hypothetical protein
MIFLTLLTWTTLLNRLVMVLAFADTCHRTQDQEKVVE